MAKKKYYAVQKGVVPGVYGTWDECKAQVDGFSGAKYKSFTSEEEALAFVAGKTDEKAEKTSRTKYEHVDVPDTPYSFVDGSFNPKTDVYGYGGFLCVGDTKYPLFGSGNNPEMASMRNVAGEICGSIAAVKKAEELGLRELTIFYDYVGIEQWATGNWRAEKPGTKAYVDFMNPDNRRVKMNFQHVKGHTGIEGNEMADVMAKHAVGVPLTRSQKELLKEIVPSKTVHPDRNLPQNGETLLNVQQTELQYGE